jgi:hypothetical protein
MTKNSSSSLLSEYIPYQQKFLNAEEVISSFRTESFKVLTYRKKFRAVNQALCKLILEAPPQSFLLTGVLEFLKLVNDEKILTDTLNLVGFEFWLNHFSNLTDEENYNIRAKITGKFIPRGEFQSYFPIGMDRTYSGSHFVAAHLSPDIDTMIASFWGWADAFSARVGTGLHLWSLPGGPPDSPVTSIFREMLGEEIFNLTARPAATLTLTAMDLVTQKKLKKVLGNVLTGDIDHGSDTAILLINEQGHYLGDWRDSDVEVVRQIIILFKSCLRWFENNLHTKLISLFAKKDLSIKDFPKFNKTIFDVKIKDCEPALEFNEKQVSDLNDFFRKILGMEQGLNGTFRDLNKAFEELLVPEMVHFQDLVESLPSSEIFEKNGHLKEDRPLIFHQFEKIINHLDAAIHSVRNYVERLDIVIGIKQTVLKTPSPYITLRSDVDEMRQKMNDLDFLTVVIPEQDGSFFPVGVVRANDLRMSALGTVSLRDFCNQEEVKMASYLEVISVIDHHKSSLRTLSVPSALIGDAQSCNVLLAELAFQINDKYSLGGLTLEEIEKQINALSSDLTDLSATRTLQNLLKRRMAAKALGNFYIHPKREFDEYLSFLHAILDDTDLLTKVSNRDVVCVASLLNRMKSLSIGKEVEIIHLDEIPKDKNFAKKAAQHILQQKDMYSLYKKIYSFREVEVDTNLSLCVNDEPSNIFLDTKVQNGCARVGQTKMFASNFPLFFEHAASVLDIWLKKSKEVQLSHPEIDLHLHMISTIASADEVYNNQIGNYKHKDELWIWIPNTQQALAHLNSFLAGFQHAVDSFKDTMTLEFSGPNSRNHARLFAPHFPEVPQTLCDETRENSPYAIFRFKAGALNSRKSMITPFLPRVIS